MFLFDVGVNIGKLNKNNVFAAIFNFEFIIKQFKNRDNLLLRGNFGT